MKLNLLKIFLGIFLLPFLAYSQACPTIKDSNGNEDMHIDCNYPFDNGWCTSVNVSFPSIAYTGTYNNAQEIAYSPIGNYNSGTPIRVYEDDLFVKKIDFSTLGNIPFTFSFFGKSYNSVLISSNGFITFDPDLKEGDFSTADISGRTLPSTYLPKSAVFGVFQDLTFKEKNGAEIYYQIEGTAPCRKLIISFYKGVIAGTTQTVSSQIVLHELTNKIDVFVENKPLADSSAKVIEALIGISDEFGNGVYPIGRNTGVWSANKEGYSFTPSGKLINAKEITWKDINDDSFLQVCKSNNCQTQICPTDNTTLSATALYEFPNDVKLYYTDEFKIIFDPNYPKAKNLVKYLCDISVQEFYQSDINKEITIHGTAISPFIFKYYTGATGYTDAYNNNSNFLDSSIPLDKSQNYFVRVESANNAQCFTIGTLKFSYGIDKNTVNICDANNDGIEKAFQLKKLNCQLFSSSIEPTKVEYLINNQIVSYADITSSTLIYVKFTTEGCSEKLYGPINVQFTSAPTVISTPINFNTVDEICDVITDYNPEFYELFNWEQEMKARGIIFSNDANVEKIKFYMSYSDAQNDVNALTRIKEGLEKDDYNYYMYARVEYNDSSSCTEACYSIVRFTVKVKFSKIILNVDDKDTDLVIDLPTVFDPEPANVYICYNGNFDVNIKNDAESTIKLISPVSGVSVTYHSDYISANNFESQGITNYDVTLPANTISKTYLVRYALGPQCYVVKPLVYTIIKPIAEKKIINICTLDSSVPLDIKLSLYNSTILGSQNTQNPSPTIIYYDKDPITDPSAIVIENLTVKKTTTVVYAKIISCLADVCDLVYPIEFKLIAVDGLINDKISIKINCDNLNDGVEYVNLLDYEKSIITNPSEYYFTYYYGYNPNNDTFSNPLLYNLNNFKIDKSQTIYVKISRSTECFRKAEINIDYDLAANPQIKLNSGLLVSCGTSQYIIFNLEKALTQIFDESNPAFNTFISSLKYYDNESDAILGNNNNFTNFNSYKLYSTTPTKNIYLRFESVYGCYSVAPLKLRIIESLKFKNNLSFSLCDDNLDGKYSLDLRNWVKFLASDKDANNDLLIDTEVNSVANFSFYNTMADFYAGKKLSADEEKNYIVEPTNPSIIVKAEIDNCTAYQTVNFELKAPQVTQFFTSDICDVGNDGMEKINLTEFEVFMKSTDETFEYYPSLLDLNNGTNKILSPEQFNADKLNDKIFVKVISSTSCPWKAEISLSFNNVPDFEIPDFKICPKDKLPLLKPDFTGLNIVSFEWKNANGEVISTGNSATNLPAGQYSLKVITNKGCVYTNSFEIIEKDVPLIEKIVAKNNTFTITAIGQQKILYSSDGINWQESNIFKFSEPGKITFFVRYDGDNCIGDTKDALVLDLINSFTPNGDGINDVWEIDISLDDSNKAVLKIFDRFGALVYTQEDVKKVFWDGTSGGRKLPTATYWYYIEFSNGSHYDGYIFLKNRN